MAACVEAISRVKVQRREDAAELNLAEERGVEELMLPHHLPEALKLVFCQRASMQDDHRKPGGGGMGVRDEYTHVFNILLIP